MGTPAGTRIPFACRFAPLSVRPWRVRRAWKRRADNTFYLGPPKTKTSRRGIGLSDDVLQAILPNLVGKGPKDFVFTTRNGSWWAAFRHGLIKQPRIHDLRHTHVSWLIAEGCSPGRDPAPDGRQKHHHHDQLVRPPLAPSRRSTGRGHGPVFRPRTRPQRRTPGTSQRRPLRPVPKA